MTSSAISDVWNDDDTLEQVGKLEKLCLAVLDILGATGREAGSQSIANLVSRLKDTLHEGFDVQRLTLGISSMGVYVDILMQVAVSNISSRLGSTNGIFVGFMSCNYYH